MTSTADPPTRSDNDGTPQSADSFDGTGAPGTGRGFVLRHGLPYAVTMIATNACGAAVTFLYAATVIVPKRLDSRGTHQLGVNLLAFLIYLAASLLVGTAWSVLRFRPTLAWLLDDRSPTTRERSITLRQPLRQLVVHAVLWLVGVALFFALNAGYDLAIARDAALATALGGLFTVALGYLLSERLLRPVTTLALARQGSEPPVAPGVVTRVVWAWAVGTGVPLLGAGVAMAIRGSTRGLADNVPELVLICIGLFASLVSMVLLARSISTPTKSVRLALRTLEGGESDVEVPVSDAGEIGQLQQAVNEMAAGRRQSERLQDLFGRQVDPDVARQALERGIELGGEARDVAVLFIDLDGSTAFASSHPPEEVVHLLNRFFRIVVAVIDAHGGIINKFDGDGALCVFGAPLDDPNAATAALSAGRELRSRVVELDDGDIDVGIGISAGNVIAGNVGSEDRFEYTVIGDAVNEASRLTDLAKQRRERLLASDAVLRLAAPDEQEHWTTGETLELPGRQRPTTLALPQ